MKKTTKTQREIMSLAHQIARETKDAAGSYRIALSCALKDIYAGLYDAKENTMKIDEFAEKYGCTVYTARNGEERVYINTVDQLMAITGLHYEGTNGHLYDAEGNQFSKNNAFCYIGKIWYSITNACMKGYNCDFSGRLGKVISDTVCKAFAACER